MFNRFLPALATVILLALCPGCSTAFHRDWNAASSGPVSQDSIEGQWEGTWLSGKNQHTGKLKCAVDRTHGKNHRFHFRATYWKLFRYSYALSFRVEERDGKQQFSGYEDLGALAGGVYHYDGTLTPDQFSATYSNKHDFGTFEMKRVQAAAKE